MDFVLFRVLFLEIGSFSSSFFLFSVIGLHSLSDLRSGGNWRVKQRYSGAQRRENAENLVRSQKFEGKKEKMKYPISKNEECPISK